VNPHKRQLVAGDAGIAGGVNWRIVEGSKAPGDLRIDWYVNDRWQPVLMDTVFVVLDLICQNEDFLYPYPQKGGLLPLEACAKARLHGYEYASGWLHLQRQNREAKASRRWEAS
jgi:hypothetical protein